MPAELLSIQPSEIKFPYYPVKAGRPFQVEQKKQIPCSLRLINETDNYVAFKIKTTAPKRYSVRPNTGIVLPGSSSDVIITMQTQRESPSDLQCKDKFLVQSVIAAYGATLKDLSQDLFSKDEGREVHEAKLKVVFVPPPQPPSPVPECSEEDASLKASTIDNGDWIFSLNEATKDVDELSAKLNDANKALDILQSERDVATRMTQRLQDDLEKLTRKNEEKGGGTVKRTTSGFSLLLVFLVGFIGVLIGYLLHR